ncbi:MAG TPA: dicarboxylate--CoA ligase PimA [Hyphomicrobiaceae bacterium]|nr:dicarboxylate--CoA ligase PimA [Hyphomicrobiaceae bacterium]
MPIAHPLPWEKSYPPGVRWDAPIEVGTLPALLARAVARYGEKPAFEYRERKISYREFGRRVDALAAGLLRLGIAKGDRVALYLPNCPAQPASLFAVVRIGGIVVNLSPLDAERELAHKLKDSGARTLVTTNIGPMATVALKIKAAGLVDRVIVADDAAWGPSPAAAAMPALDDGVLSLDEVAAAEPPALWPKVVPDDIALLQYTGGTTGLPKGAILSHANLTAAVEIGKAWSIPQGTMQPGDGRIICVLPLFHMYAITACLTRGLDYGNEILLRLRFDVEQTLRDITEKKATTFSGVPTMWIAIANHPGVDKLDFSSLKSIHSGGAAVPVEIENRIKSITGLQLGGGWGMTETAPAGANIPTNRPDLRGSIGLPLPGILMDVVALDDPRRVLAPGEIGEIRVKGPNVTRGYWNRPEETAAAFVDGYLLTGDIGYMDAEGFFFLTDRKKDMIISGGFNVYPRMIEEAIYEHPAVEEVIVIGIPDAYRGQAAKAYIKLKAGAQPFTLDDLRAFLADKIGRHELPSALEFRESLPKTAVGKLSKKELVAEEMARRAVASEPAST